MAMALRKEQAMAQGNGAERKRQRWQREIDRWQRSGESIRAFCQR